MNRLASGLILLFVASSAYAGVTMDPALEGIYQIQITCAQSSPTCDASNFADIDRLSIIDTQQGRFGLWLSLGSAAEGDYVDTFIAAQVGPASDQVTGLPFNSGMGGGGRGGGGDTHGPFSYVGVTIDPKTGDLSGTVIDNSVLAPFNISGKKIRFAGDLLAKSLPSLIKPAQFVGIYHGTMGKASGSMLINLLPNGQLVGKLTISDSEGALFSLEFSQVLWDPAHGILKLQFSNPRFFAMGEVMVAVHATPGGSLLFDGFEFSLFADNSFSMH